MQAIRHLPFLALLAFAGCTATAVPPQAALTPPLAPAVELPPASITGFEEKSTLLDNFTVFVAAIDGVPAPDGRLGWDKPLPLPAGPRRLSLEFNRGVFKARVEVQLTAASEKGYQVRFATDAELFGDNSYCEFWIVDTATGLPVTNKVRTPLTRIEGRAKGL